MQFLFVFFLLFYFLQFTQLLILFQITLNSVLYHRNTDVNRKTLNYAGVNGLQKSSDFFKTELGTAPNQEILKLTLNPNTAIFLGCMYSHVRVRNSGPILVIIFQFWFRVRVYNGMLRRVIMCTVVTLAKITTRFSISPRVNMR